VKKVRIEWKLIAAAFTEPPPECLRISGVAITLLLSLSLLSRANHDIFFV